MPEERIRPPYASLAVIAATLPAGAVAWWWSMEAGMGVAVALIVANFGLAAMGMNLDRRRRRRRLREDLSKPLIRNGIGQVVSEPDGEALVRAGGGETMQPGPGLTPPPPGWYRLYWLEHPRAQAWHADRVLLSARLIETIEPERGHTPPAAALLAAGLERALGFDSGDLEHNRAGTLSAPQWLAVRRGLRGGMVGAAAGFLAGLARAEAAAPAPGRAEAAAADGGADPELQARLDGLARTRRIRRSLLAMIPAAVVTAAVLTPYVVHHYAPERTALLDDISLQVTLGVVAVYVLGWVVYAVSALRRR